MTTIDRETRGQGDVEPLDIGAQNSAAPAPGQWPARASDRFRWILQPLRIPVKPIIYFGGKPIT
jgi:hypothetical protein